MHVAIDDTYGPETTAPTRYVTAARRTYVAVEFQDEEVNDVRRNISDCLDFVANHFSIAAREFHFTEIYNRRGPWKELGAGANLRLFEFFTDIYRRHQWRVHVQTVDDRTLADHNMTLSGDFDGIDLADRDGQALSFLLVKLKHRLPPPPNTLVVRADAGKKKPGARIGSVLFREWGREYDGQYATSEHEPTIQIADFLAFCINRTTYLQMKNNLSVTDLRFLELVGSMEIRSDDIRLLSSSPADLRAEVDGAHRKDRREKGLE